MQNSTAERKPRKRAEARVGQRTTRILKVEFLLSTPTLFLSPLHGDIFINHPWRLHCGRPADLTHLVLPAARNSQEPFEWQVAMS
jgi:hypothetical protein